MSRVEIEQYRADLARISAENAEILPHQPSQPRQWQLHLATLTDEELAQYEADRARVAEQRARKDAWASRVDASLTSPPSPSDLRDEAMSYARAMMSDWGSLRLETTADVFSAAEDLASRTNHAYSELVGPLVSVLSTNDAYLVLSERSPALVVRAMVEEEATLAANMERMEAEFDDEERQLCAAEDAAALLPVPQPETYNPAQFLPQLPARRRLADSTCGIWDLEERLPTPDPLIERVLGCDMVAVLGGQSQTYKSFIALAWACHLATGTAWEGHGVPEARTVLYVAAEGPRTVVPRVKAWQRRTGHQVPNDRLQIVYTDVMLMDDSEHQQLIELANRHGAGLVIIDTLSQCVPGMKENDAGEASQLIARAGAIRASVDRCTVLLVHHAGKVDGWDLRGSSGLLANVDMVWMSGFVSPVGDDGAGMDVQRALRQIKNKDGEYHPQIQLRLEPDSSVGGASITEGKADEAPGGTTPLWLGARAVAERLDGLGLPRDAGRDRCYDALERAGMKGNQRSLKEAVRMRKEAGSGPLPEVPAI